MMLPGNYLEEIGSHLLQVLHLQLHLGFLLNPILSNFYRKLLVIDIIKNVMRIFRKLFKNYLSDFSAKEGTPSPFCEKEIHPQ